MTIVFVSVVAVAVLLILLLKDQKKPEDQTGGSKADFSRRLLFTESEAKFYHALRSLLPSGFEVWGKLGHWRSFPRKPPGTKSCRNNSTS